MRGQKRWSTWRARTKTANQMSEHWWVTDCAEHAASWPPAALPPCVLGETAVRIRAKENVSRGPLARNIEWKPPDTFPRPWTSTLRICPWSSRSSDSQHAKKLEESTLRPLTQNSMNSATVCSSSWLSLASKTSARCFKGFPAGSPSPQVHVPP